MELMKKMIENVLGLQNIANKTRPIRHPGNEMRY
jgi:hypothetical protein